MNRSAVLIILQSLILLLVPCFHPPVYAGELLESKKDLSGIAESDPEIYQEVIDAGAKTLILKGRKPFMVYWVPENFSELPKRRVLVVMHGTNGNAYRHLSNFLDTAKKHKFGILSVQWGWATNKRTLKGKPKFKYIEDARNTYALINAGLEYLAKRYRITKDECAWSGFSRSSTQCAVFAHLDKNEGKGYFKLFIASSGGIGNNLSIMRDLLSGKYGNKPIAGQHFYLWAGKRDNNRIEDMQKSKSTIEKLGGIVDIFRIGPEGHGGFNHNLQYQEEACALWFSLCSKKLTQILRLEGRI
ncbi:hypothetical protein J7M23_00920 [Candidatus Sumerlaeota bacterium]|nr:hypothetical protein [Candidatus Sumerlaeota bacterium]